MRRSYEQTGVDVDDLPADPVQAFDGWFDAAVTAGIVEPNAMVLATVDADGAPAARTVLLKGYDHEGLRFFTNLGSAKARDLAANSRAALVFPWHPMSRQVRVTGRVERLPDADAAAYFASRPRGSQLGAWASPQSTVVHSRETLDAALDEVEQRFPAGTPVPLPPFWGGYLVRPDSWEFWAGRVGRLHDRISYRRKEAGSESGWTVARLAP